MEIEASITEEAEKVNSRRSAASSSEESDGVIVPEKLANKGATEWFGTETEGANRGTTGVG